MLLVILLCVLSCVCAVIAWRKRVTSSHEHPLPPVHPGELPLIGHAHLMLGDRKNIWKFFKELASFCNDNGGATYMRLGREIYYVITDPDDALTVGNHCLDRHYIFKYTTWLGEGLLTAPVDVWKRHRKLLNPGFGVQMAHGFLDVFNCQSRRLASDLDSYVGKGPFDISLIIQIMVARTSFYTIFGGIDEKNKKDVEQFTTYMDTLQDLVHMVMKRAQTFWLHSHTLFTLFGYEKYCTKQGVVLKKVTSELLHRNTGSLASGVNHESMDEYQSPVSRQKSFVDLALQLSNDGALTEKELIDELNTILVGSFETTANHFVVLLILLGSYPEVQKRAYKEIMEVVGNDGEVNKEDLPKLVYTEAVIKESLRVYASAPLIARSVDKEVKLKNYTMRPGSQCIVISIGLHRNTAWGADSDKFNPDRWLGQTPPSNIFIGFGVGRRACVGKAYAMTSIKVMLVHLLRQYKVTADVSKLQFEVGITMTPVEGHKISLERRN